MSHIEVDQWYSVTEADLQSDEEHDQDSIQQSHHQLHNDDEQQETAQLEVVADQAFTNDNDDDDEEEAEAADNGHTQATISTSGQFRQRDFSLQSSHARLAEVQKRKNIRAARKLAKRAATATTSDPDTNSSDTTRPAVPVNANHTEPESAADRRLRIIARQAAKKRLMLARRMNSKARDGQMRMSGDSKTHMRYGGFDNVDGGLIIRFVAESDNDPTAKSTSQKQKKRAKKVENVKRRREMTIISTTI